MSRREPSLLVKICTNEKQNAHSVNMQPQTITEYGTIVGMARKKQQATKNNLMKIWCEPYI